MFIKRAVYERAMTVSPSIRNDGFSVRVSRDEKPTHFNVPRH